MKVLFLDIDGVLNSQNWFGFMKYCEDNGTVEKILNYVDTNDDDVKYKLHMLDDRAIANLNRIIDATGCRVVLASSWRSSRDSDNIFTQYVLKLKGFKYDFYGITPRLWHKEFGTQRGEEIQMWIDKELEKNEITSYVILDDDNDMLPEQMDNFILVNNQYGLSDIDVFKAIEILNK